MKDWHAKHSEQGFGINQRELLQISNPSQQNQRGCPLSTGPLYFLYLNRQQANPHIMAIAIRSSLAARNLMCARLFHCTDLKAFDQGALSRLRSVRNPK
jgi:hypothetical protein